MLKCATKKRKNATKLGAKGTTYKICYKPKRKTTIEPVRFSAVGQKKKVLKQLKQKVKKVYKSRWSAPLTPTLPSNPRY